MSRSAIRAFIDDLFSIKWYFAASLAIFALGIGIGAQNELLNEYMNGQIEPLRDVVERLESMENSQLWMFLFIFFNNFIKALLVVFLGAFFGLFPVYFLLLNGMVLGFVVSVAGESGVDVVPLVVKGILPHGILEITAVIIAASYGLRYGVLVFSALAGAFRKRGSTHKLKEFHGTLKRLVAFLFLALLAAAFIESTITYMLVRG